MWLCETLLNVISDLPKMLNVFFITRQLSFFSKRIKGVKQ